MARNLLTREDVMEGIAEMIQFSVEVVDQIVVHDPIQ